MVMRRSLANLKCKWARRFHSTDPAVIAANIAVKVSSGDPDYAGMSPEAAKEDFLKRIRNYEAAYQSVDEQGQEAHLAYCKITDVGRSVVVNRFGGYLESRIGKST